MATDKASKTHNQTVKCVTCTQTLEIQGLRGLADAQDKKQVASLRHGSSSTRHIVILSRSENVATASSK